MRVSYRGVRPECGDRRVGWSDRQVSGMRRVLDIDLDAFVYGSEDGRSRHDARLDEEVHPSWDLPKVLSFLCGNCGLDGPLPGFAVEHHSEVFFRWRDAIDRGLLAPPLQVTHVDAHADLGTGDIGFDYLLTELLREPPQNRHSPKTGDDGLGDGNYLAFAIANRWVDEVKYVIGGRHEDYMDYPWQPGDLLPPLFEDFDLSTRTIRLPTLELRNLRENLGSTDGLKPLALEPPVSFDWSVWHEFEATEPFDLICLARSPSYTPAAADNVYDEIRRRFIDESAVGRACQSSGTGSISRPRRR